MALYTRAALPALLRQAATEPARVYLLFGERYLCRNAAEELEQILLRPTGGLVHHIDGDQEDFAATLTGLRTYSLLPGRQVYRVTDTRLFHSRQTAKSIWDRAVKAHAGGDTERAARTLRLLLASAGSDNADSAPELYSLSADDWQEVFGFARPAEDLGWTAAVLAAHPGQAATTGAADPGELLVAALDQGLPENNFLLLLAEEVDKRKKLFKHLKNEQAVLDLSVESGAGKKAQQSQQGVLLELIRRTLKEQGKTMEPGLENLLFDRVGFHPVAVVMELRKVMTYLGERQHITREDLDLLVGRTRQEALFELTAALADNDREQTLLLGERLRDNGIHPLAVVATLRNFARGLLLCRSLMDQGILAYQPSMPFTAFQQTCLPRLKERPPWDKEFTGHPYAVYMQFKTAASFSLPILLRWMQLLLQAEMRLKGSSVAEKTVLQHLLLGLLATNSAKK
ncbi:MAG: DNA polymerase III subunit delta [Desulfobulbus sp.]|jgi:DNA polymerase-3 subunit delta